jgi:hypothetical protein
LAIANARAAALGSVDLLAHLRNTTGVLSRLIANAIRAASKL